MLGLPTHGRYQGPLGEPPPPAPAGAWWAHEPRWATGDLDPREGNALINELIIGIGSKDYWSMSQPVNDSQFASFDLDPPFVHIVDALYAVLAPGALNSPPAPRNDLLPLVTYAPPIAASGTTAGPVADLLRINTGVAPTAPATCSTTTSRAGGPTS